MSSWLVSLVEEFGGRDWEGRVEMAETEATNL